MSYLGTAMTPTIKAIIIEDEARAQRILAKLLAEYCPTLEVVAIAGDVPEGVLAIKRHKPTVVFLDIEMPGYTGFQLLDFFDVVDFSIIFTTAYQEHAIKAFRVSAVDYLLKPIQIDQLIKAVDKLNPNHGPEQRAALATLKENVRENKIKRIVVPQSDGITFIDIEEIIYFSADGAYTNIYLRNGTKILVSRKIKEYDELLEGTYFFRTHRSFLVNLSEVRRLVRQDGGHIIMKDDRKISLSAQRKDAFLQALSDLA